ncbi:MAG: carbohydrate kinase family protein [Pseudomonadota bacterium]
MARILVIGGAHIDRRAKISVPTVHGASNPGRWYEEAGGGGFNAARGLARLGNSVAMVSVRGGDAAGEAVALAVEEAGIADMAQVFLDRATPSYSAVIDDSGNLVIAIADMDLYDRFVHRQLSRKSIREAIGNADFVLCDANLPADTLGALSSMTEIRAKPLAAIAVSPAKAPRLTQALAKLAVLFVNASEASALCDAPDQPEQWPQRLRDLGVTRAVITNGTGPVLGFDEEIVFRLMPPLTDRIVDETGAGDALAAATIDALARGSVLCEAVRYGIAAAGVTVRSAHAAAPDLDHQVLSRELERVPEPHILT